MVTTANQLQEVEKVSIATYYVYVTGSAKVNHLVALKLPYFFNFVFS